MARLYGTIKGCGHFGIRETGRTGRKQLEAHIRGWTTGVMVRIEVDDEGREVYTIYKTGGSDRPDDVKPIKTFVDKYTGPRDRRGRPKASFNGRSTHAKHG